MTKIAIKKGQIWKSRYSNKQFRIICRTRDDKWKAVELTERNGVYASSHSFLARILWKRFTLIT